jgi:putative membrane protein
MKQLAWFFKWTLKAAIFFTLFAFALNNQHDATVRFFFGQQWTAPLVLVVLSAFALGLVIGVLGMVPRWWQHRRAAAQARQAAKAAATAEKPAPLQPPYGI